MGSLFRCALGLALVGSLVSPVRAQGQHCTLDTLTVSGTAVAIKICAPTGATAPSIAVSESLRADGRSIARGVELPVLAGAEVSRMTDLVSLHPLGLEGSLHMTLAYRAGSVSLEHALLLPGAIPLK